MRVAEPLTLATYLIRDKEQWTPKKIEKVAKSGKETFIRLSEKLPIHIRYYTAWVDEAGRVNFRHDVYRKDR